MMISSSNSSETNTLIIIAGPTGVGKTKLAIELAGLLNTEILSCDSRQFYKEMTIGTAVPTKDELNKIKHHFIQHKSINDYYNISLFENDALYLLKELFKKHHTVIMTGGSGMYIDVICNGIAQLPDADLGLRKRLKEEFQQFGLPYIQNQLLIHDPVYYKTVDLSNPNRILRALEVCIQTGEKYSDARKFSPAKRDFVVKKICITRERHDLYQRINQRVDQMIKDGLIQESKQLYPFKHLQALNTVGYKELFMHFENKISLEDAIEKIKTNTRRYAKRQLTWFKKDENYTWISYDDNISTLIKTIKIN